MIDGIGGSGFPYNNMMLAPVGQFKPPQIEELDANQDGGIDTVEFESFTDKLPAGKGVENFFTRIDSDSDGLISQDEMQIAGAKHRESIGDNPGKSGGMGGPGGLASLMNVLDDDEDDGTILGALDTNKNGILEEEELNSGMTKLLRKFQNTAYERSDRTDNGPSDGLDLTS